MQRLNREAIRAALCAVNTHDIKELLKLTIIREGETLLRVVTRCDTAM